MSYITRVDHRLNRYHGCSNGNTLARNIYSTDIMAVQMETFSDFRTKVDPEELATSR